MITEPMTMLTDYLIAAFALVWGGRLWSKGRQQGVVTMCWWGGWFLAIAVAATAGGTAHGFRLVVGAQGEALLWRITLSAVGVVVFCAIATILRAAYPTRARRVLMVANGIYLTAYLALFAQPQTFVKPLSIYGVALVVILLPLIFRRVDTSGPEARWLLIGGLISVVAGLLHRAGVGFHQHFNNDDLYHVIQLVGLYAFYRGGQTMKDR